LLNAASGQLPINQLTADEKAEMLVLLCERYGLDPITGPFAILQQKGGKKGFDGPPREVVYATRSCTDQLAEKFKISREIVDGPLIRDFDGQKMAYAKCRASTPDGRTETASATLFVSDLENLLMKVETKAKRRATLAMMGIPMPDELETETFAPGAETIAVAAPRSTSVPTDAPALPAPSAGSTVPAPSSPLVVAIKRCKGISEVFSLLLAQRAETESAAAPLIADAVVAFVDAGLAKVVDPVSLEKGAVFAAKKSADFAPAFRALLMPRLERLFESRAIEIQEKAA
jgi:hypothetical protein